MNSNGIVLCVDDNQRNREVCELNLSMDGFEVLLAENGRQGLEIAESARPDAILLDIMMPVMDGFETLTRIRSNVDLAETPVLMLTARAAVEDVVKALDLGANDYLRKPFEIDEMAARVKTLVNLKKAQDAVRENQRRLAEELALARGIQDNLLPSDSFLKELKPLGLKVFAFTSPASEVNGDFYDIRRLGRDLVCFSLVDCMGHGVSAGMMTMAVHALLDSLVPILASAGEPLNHLDRKLRQIGVKNDFAAIMHLFYDPYSGTINISRAGMPDPVYFRAEGGKLSYLDLPPGPPLGLSRKPPPYQEAEIKIDYGDKLIMYSDGLTECGDERGEPFAGTPQLLLDRIEPLKTLEADELGPALLEEWRKWTDNHQDDDCTLLILEKTD